MKFSIFEMDDGIGSISPLGTVLITATGIVPNATAAGLKGQVESALRAGSWEFISVNGTYNSTYGLASVRVTTKIYQSLDVNWIRREFLSDMARAGLTFSGVSVSILSRDLASQASVFVSPRTTTPRVTTPRTTTPRTPANGGVVVAANPPATTPNDPAARSDGGLLGLGATTWILIGLAGVLVVNKL